MESGKYMVFKGSIDNFIQNGALVLEESISLFHGRGNPIRYFSVDELNSMNLEQHSMSFKEWDVKWYKGFWDGRCVLVKEQSEKYDANLNSGTFREIVVAAQMSAHKNVHKLLGCCLETKYTVLVFEWVENDTLHDIIFRDKNHDKPPLGWRERLRISWEISHAMAYLHAAFHRPIIHRSLKPRNVYLGEDNAAKLSDFSLSISVPEGEEYVEDIIVGTYGYLAPEYGYYNRVSESVDVYAFGVFFLVLLTGKDAVLIRPDKSLGDNGVHTHIVEWVKNGLGQNSISEIIDPVIGGNKLSTNEELKEQLRASVELALRCTETEEHARPTMVDVATELNSMIKSSESFPECSSGP
uniref:Protein kinase domain-containing protein n=2 Tax=Chenopodium quinoa TaxID=63459 RepID=A0A803N6J4_CHEQI